MNISEVMTVKPLSAAPTDSALLITKIMASADVGFVPVVRNGQLIGVITDRDILARVVAPGIQADGALAGSIASDAISCYVDDTVEDVAAMMDDLLVRRLPVVDRSQNLVGIVSIEDIRPRGSRPGGFERNIPPTTQKLQMPAVDPVEEAGDESFPASDPPSFNATRAAPRK